MSTNILTPVGRLVTGDCFVPNTTDFQGRPLMIKTGKNAGQSKVDYFMGIAVEKSKCNELMQAILLEARTAYPDLFDANGNCLRPDFAFKFIDGDSITPNQNNKRPCDQEGYPGCYIFKFNGMFAPKCYDAQNHGIELTDPERIKRGYYIRISGSVSPGTDTAKPSIFLNHNYVELCGFGDVIQSGPSAEEVFGGTPMGVLPAGASVTPLAPQAPAAPGPAATVQPGTMQTYAPAPATVPIAQALATPAVQPRPEILDLPKPIFYQTPDGKKWTEAQLLAAQFSPEQIAALPHDDIPF